MEVQRDLFGFPVEPSSNGRAIPDAPPPAPVGDEEQKALFDVGEWWEDEWQGMPEFVQNDNMPFRTIYVHFDKKADVETFAQLIGQKITPETKSLWFPEAEIQHWDHAYVDEAKE